MQSLVQRLDLPYSIFFYFSLIKKLLRILIDEQISQKKSKSNHKRKILLSPMQKVQVIETNSRYFRFAFIFQKGIFFMMKFFTPIFAVRRCLVDLLYLSARLFRRKRNCYDETLVRIPRVQLKLPITTCCLLTSRRLREGDLGPVFNEIYSFLFRITN